MFGQRRQQQAAQQRAELAAALRGLGQPEPARKHLGLAVLRAAHAVAWRYRRQLAPLACIAGLWALGALVDHAGVPAPGVALLAALGAGLWWRLRLSRRLNRPVERRYAAACLGAAAVWLVLVAAVGLG